MRKLLPLIFTSLFLALVILLNIIVPTFAQSDKCANPSALDLVDIQDCLDNLTRARDQSAAATAGVQKQIDGIRARVSFIENDMAAKQRQINKSQEELAKIMDVLYATIRSYYMESQGNCPICDLLINPSISDFVKIQAYEKTRIDRDKAFIINTAHSIQTLETSKAELEEERASLATVKTSLDKVVTEARAYQATLSSQIASLSARQQQILSQRLAALNIPRSAGTSAKGCSDDRGVNPGFSPRLAFFSYGAPHRNGLNQYGAWGRAKAGQNEETILSEYYPGKTLRKDYDQNIQISTTTGWSGSIEDYVKRIYEVPDSWTDNNSAVLKAQAVAARTYALNVASNGAKQICTTEQCQVFKPDPKGGNWDGAVEATRGWVLTDGGSPAFTQYASTHGGYIQNLGKFDGRDAAPTNFSELNDRAYDKESPWFYCDWGSRSLYSNTAWLKTDEVADIVNVVLLAQEVNNDSAVTSHLYQTDKPNPAGTDTWDSTRVKQELQNRGRTPFNSVSSANVSADFGSGKASNITLNGDAGSITFSGEFFKSYFNLRAPANIQIVGPLYNVERQ